MTHLVATGYPQWGNKTNSKIKLKLWELCALCLRTRLRTRSFSAHTVVNLMTSFQCSPPPLLTSILLNADSNLACHVPLACGVWLKDFTGTLTALLDNQMHIFWLCILVEPVF